MCYAQILVNPTAYAAWFTTWFIYSETVGKDYIVYQQINKLTSKVRGTRYVRGQRFLDDIVEVLLLKGVRMRTGGRSNYL